MKSLRAYSQVPRIVQMRAATNSVRHLIIPTLVAIFLLSWLGSPGSGSGMPGTSSTVLTSSASGQMPLGENAWTSGGPKGAGAVFSLAIDPSNRDILYAGTAGLFKSTNGGTSWTGPSADLGDAVINTIAINAQNSNVVYAGSDGARVFKSTDGGASWVVANSGISYFGGHYNQIQIRALKFDPQVPDIIYAGTVPSGVFKTTDGGTSWKATNNGLSDMSEESEIDIRALEIDRSRPETLYVATFHPGGPVDMYSGVFKSTDGGATWRAVNSGLPNLYHQGDATDVAIAPSDSNTLYLGTRTGLAKSTNGGATWNTINSGLPACRFCVNVRALAIHPMNPSTVYVGTIGDGASASGVIKSINGGASWSANDPSLFNVIALAIDPANPSAIYAGTYGGGLFKSTDAGSNWTASNTGLNSQGASFVAVDPASANIVYGGSGGGVFRSVDFGASWSPIETGVTDAALLVGDLKIDPRNSNTLYLATVGSGPYDYSAGEGIGVRKSADGGMNWTPINNGLPHWVSTLEIDPFDPDTLYAGTISGVYKSTNGGASWRYASDTQARNYTLALAVDPSVPNVLYAIAYDDDDYFEEFGTGLYKSTDAGNSWRPLKQAASYVTVDPNNSNTLYASNGVVYKSADGGTNWLALSVVANCVTVDPSNSNIVFAATPPLGVLRSTDGGASWSPFNTGLTNLDVNTLTIDRSGTSLHAGTGAGVFDYQFSIGCVDSISPTTETFDERGGDSSVSITASDECSWAATNSASWITITSGSSATSGNGTVSYSVQPNPVTLARTGVVVIAARAFTITQAGLPVRITSASVRGRKLFVNGEHFDAGAVILLNGEEQKTINNSEPGDTLIGKKAGKKTKSGDKLQVRNSNGSMSAEFTFIGD
jgi:photosystem II stability/assembly factor-like uncharacterized protein